MRVSICQDASNPAFDALKRCVGDVVVLAMMARQLQSWFLNSRDWVNARACGSIANKLFKKLCFDPRIFHVCPPFSFIKPRISGSFLSFLFRAQGIGLKSLTLLFPQLLLVPLSSAFQGNRVFFLHVHCLCHLSFDF